MKLVNEIEALRERICCADLHLATKDDLIVLVNDVAGVLGSTLDVLYGPPQPILVEDVSMSDVEYPGCHLPLASLAADDLCGRCGYRADQHRGWHQTQNYRNRFSKHGL